MSGVGAVAGFHLRHATVPCLDSIQIELRERSAPAHVVIDHVNNIHKRQQRTAEHANFKKLGLLANCRGD